MKQGNAFFRLGLAATAVLVSSLVWAQIAPIAGKNNPRRLYQLADLKQTTMKVGSKAIKVWIMDTFSKRMEGMMFLAAGDVPDNQGMLFLFKEATPQGFWMKNCFFDLDIAYMGADKKILNCAVMKAHDENSVKSKGPSQFVLEMKRGAFKRLGIKAGMKCSWPASVSAVD